MKIAHGTWLLAAAVAAAALVASLEGYAVWFKGEWGFTPGPDPVSGFNILGGATSLASALLCLGLALTLFLRKRHEPMALFVSFYILTYGIVLAGPLENLNPVFPGIADLAIGLIQPLLLSAPTIWLIILLPDGRLVPRWARWVGLLSIASMAMLPFLDSRSIATANTFAAQVMYVLWIAQFVLAFGAQVYRYRRISTPAQREQTRWVVFGLIIWLGLMFAQAAPYLYLQNLPQGAEPPSWAAASAAMWWLALSVIPVTLTVAILRHRLYDIDLIINRALVYGALTAILAGMYSASISLFQKLFIAFTGEKSDAAIVVTTLILASTFTPVKARLQAVVDRRFRDTHDPLHRLTVFSTQIDSGIWIVDRRRALERLLEECMAALNAVGGQVTWVDGGSEKVVATRGHWAGDSRIVAPLAVNGRLEGWVSFGPRLDDAPYESEDARALTVAADAVARSLRGGRVPLTAERLSGRMHS